MGWRQRLIGRIRKRIAFSRPRATFPQKAVQPAMKKAAPAPASSGQPSPRGEGDGFRQTKGQEHPLPYGRESRTSPLHVAVEDCLRSVSDGFGQERAGAVAVYFHGASFAELVAVPRSLPVGCHGLFWPRCRYRRASSSPRARQRCGPPGPHRFFMRAAISEPHLYG